MPLRAIHYDCTSLPGTIRDAITIVQKLSIRYLLVDSLCLLQDNTEDLQRGVGVIDHIYKRLGLTIVAACGRNANAGLLSVRVVRKKGVLARGQNCQKEESGNHQNNRFETISTDAQL